MIRYVLLSFYLVTLICIGMISNIILYIVYHL